MEELDSSKIFCLWALGYFVLRTGAAISDELRLKIAKSATIENDVYDIPDKEELEDREMRLKDLRDKILNHKAGKISYLIEDSNYTDT